MSGPHCFHNPPTLEPNSGQGKVEQLGGFKTYVSGPQHSKLAILLISDAYGYEAPNLRKIADDYAAAGFLAYVPDFLYGDPFTEHRANPLAWLAKHSPDKGAEDARALISTLKSRGVSKIGAAGFCWGGLIVERLATDVDSIQAAVLLHPGPITVDEINEVKVPIAILGAEVDHFSPPEDVKKLEVALAKKPQIDSFVKIFPGVTHGWTTRYDPKDEFVVRCAKEAQSDTFNWLSKYIK